MSNDYTCLTCSETFNQDIQKHLSTTRHKSVKLNFYDDEILQCEDCQDTNIHQLTIVRYGFSDMSLLCSLCLDKENKSSGETPSASYSLSNGAIFLKLQQYLKFRDIECLRCGNDQYLYVGNSKSGQIISCRKCLPEFENEGIKFTSENDDTFLKELLGLKETVVKKSNRRRKVGKGRGKGKGKFGKKSRVKKEDPEAEERRAHYFESKKFAQEVKSGSTVKAIGSEGEKPDSKFSKSKNNTFKSKSTPNSGRQTPVKHTPTNSGKQTPAKLTPTSSGRLTPKPQSKPKVNDDNKKFAKSIDRPTKAPKQPNNSSGNTKENIPKNNQTSKKPNSNEAKFDNKGQTKANGKNKKSNATDPSKSDNTKPNKADSKSFKSSKKSTNDIPDKTTTKATKKSTNDKSTKLTKQDSISQTTKPILKSDDFIIPPYITKYLPSSKARLTYDSIDEYFREMSFNMFLEDQLNNVSKLMDSSYFTIEWYEDQDKKNNQFKLSIPLKNIEKFVSQKLKNLKKNPFNVDQALFLILDNDIPWYCKIATMDEIKKGGNKLKRGRGGKGRVGNSEITIEMIITLFKWNNQQLPKTVHVQHLQILPASIPLSRVFTAMDNLSNPTFIKMLLGKEPIKQINFRNYVKFSKPTINDSQKIAIQSVLNNSITVLQGPPGTGKTSTIFEIILQLLTSLNTYPILVVAASNIAIDNIAEKLIESGHGKDILRITANEKERDYDSSHPLHSVCLHTKIFNALSLKFKDVVHDLQFNPSKVSANAYKKYLGEKFLITKQFVRQAKVILTTTVVAGGPQLKSVEKCPVVIMDEATQSSEPTSLIPLSMSGVDKYVFVGDSKQLSCFTLIPSLSVSLFERILLNGSYKNPHMLDTQYRMHPDISDFPRNRFYQGLLKDGITKEARKVENVANPVYFWDTKGEKPEKSIKNFLREDHGFTYTNPGEIENIITAIKTLIYEKNIKREDIGIITPYSGQRDLISSTLIKNEFINVSQEELKLEIDIDDISNDSKPVTIHYVSGIMVASIDAFQGREKDFLIMSCVRSNDQNKIGFIKDERRLNVALTRAKYGLIMIGDANCLKNGDKLWNEYLTYLNDKSAIHQEFIY